MSKTMYCFIAHAHFEAEDLDDAFDKLGNHFMALAAGNIEEESLLKFEPQSELKLKPFVPETLQ